jgi:hypothetical protein
MEDLQVTGPDPIFERDKIISTSSGAIALAASSMNTRRSHDVDEVFGTHTRQTCKTRPQQLQTATATSV